MILALVGDVMLGRGVAAEMGRRDPASFWGDVAPLLLGSDIVIANLECAITASGAPWRRTPKVFHFRAPPVAVEVLRAGRIGAVSLANNHVLDFEVEGLLDTLGHLDRAGIVHAGAGSDLGEASSPAIMNADGGPVALLAFTDNEPAWAASAAQPGTNYLEVGPDALRNVAQGIDRARAAGAHVVVLSIHWGPNMVERPPPHFREFARRAVDLGVAVVHGHSAHVFQGVEVYRGRPILYDTGDFLDDYAVDPVLRNDRSFVFLADIVGDRVRELRAVPVRLRYAAVARAAGRDFDEACARMRKLSVELGSTVEREDSHLRWDLGVGHENLSDRR